MRRRSDSEMCNTQNARSKERSAIKVFRRPDPWTTIPKRKQIWDGNAEALDNRSIVKVAQRGPIYGYSYLGLKVIQ